MYRLVSKLIIYRNIGRDSILSRMAEITKKFDSGDYEKEELTSEIYDQIHRLLDLSTTYGFNKNLWHNYLAFLLAMTETPFTLVSEKTGENEGSVNAFAMNDFAIFKKLFAYDFGSMEQELGINVFSIIENYHAVVKQERVFNKSVSDKVQELSREIESAKNEDDIYHVVTGFYRQYGVGKFGLNKAFRVNDQMEDGDFLIPITNTSDVVLDDLVGYEVQKKKLIDNTEAFVQGRKANNVLLYGDAGTGKSTSVKAVLNQYYSQGLRMIEVYKHEFKYLQRIIDMIKNRNYRFIIYMDDLSFEDFETDYKYLKAIIEGGVEQKPENVLIYATSNRRHLIRETPSDKNDRDEDLHRSDNVAEKLSLSERFGVQIPYLKPSVKEYLHIVRELADRYPEIVIDEDELTKKANQWELTHGGASGRTAQQFIDYLAGKGEKDEMEGKFD